MRTIAGSVAMLCMLVSHQVYAESPTGAPTVVGPAAGPVVGPPVAAPAQPGGPPAQGGVPLMVTGEGMLVLYPAGNMAQPLAQCNAPCQLLVQPGPYTVQVQNRGVAQQDVDGAADGHVGTPRSRTRSRAGRALIIVGAISLAGAALAALVALVLTTCATGGYGGCDGAEVDTWLISGLLGAIGVAARSSAASFSRAGSTVPGSTLQNSYGVSAGCWELHPFQAALPLRSDYGSRRQSRCERHGTIVVANSWRAPRDPVRSRMHRVPPRVKCVRLRPHHGSEQRDRVPEPTHRVAQRVKRARFRPNRSSEPLDRAREPPRSAMIAMEDAMHAHHRTEARSKCDSARYLARCVTFGLGDSLLGPDGLRVSLGATRLFQPFGHVERRYGWKEIDPVHPRVAPARDVSTERRAQRRSR